MPGLYVKRCLLLAALVLGARESGAGECSVGLVYQKQSYWCWAASAEMIRKYWNPSSGVQQCDDANYAGSRGYCGIPSGINCCDAGSSCNRTCTPQIQRDFPSTEIRYGYLTKSEVASSLGASCSPFIFLYLLPGGIPHWRVARGFLDSPWGKWIHINDPNPLLQDQTYILYDDYKANSTQSWFRIHP